MKSKKTRRILSFVLSLLLFLTLCTPTIVMAADVETQSSNEVVITVGEATILKVSGWSYSTTWESSDTDVAIVSRKGVVTGIAPGTAIITAISKGFYFGKQTKTEFTVKVIEPEESDAIQIKVGETTTLSAPSESGTTTWKSSDTNIATVSSDGVVTGLSKGTVTVTATTKSGGYKFWFIIWGETTTTKKYTIVVTDEGETPEPDKETFTVTFESNGGSVVEDQTVQEGDKAARPEDPTKEGYTFVGWYVDEELTTEYDFDVAVNGNIVLYAKWEEVPVAIYTVTFESNGGSTVESQSVEEGKTIIKPTDPTKEGYIFGGWYTDEELTIEYDFDTEVTSDITLYAKWEEALATIYTVTFESNGGSAVESQQIESGNQATQPDDPAREGYNFVAWYSDQELTEVYDFETVVTSDITLYAKWNEIAEEEHSFIDEEEPDIEIYSFDTDTWDVLVNETVTVTFTAEIFSEVEIDGNEVKVIDESNNIIGYMNDNGESGDAIANDGIYTLKVDLLSSEQKVVSYFASVGDIKSAGVSISYYVQYSEGDFQIEDDVVNLLDEAVSEYLDENGYLIDGKYADAIASISNKLDELIEEGIVDSYNVNENNISINLVNGIPFVYMLLIDDETDSGIGNGTIATFQPFKGTYNSTCNTLSDNATDGSAETIRSEFSGYTWPTDLDLNSVTLENLRNMSNHSVVLWHGHGGCNIYGNEGSSLAIGELVNSTTSSQYSSDISARRIITCRAANRNVYAITGGFVQKYIGNMNGSFLYLAACESGLDMVNDISETYNLVQAFINKGASAVVANSETICTSYNTAMEEDVVSAMCELNNDSVNYYTLSQSLQIAFSENGNYCCETHRAHPIIFPENRRNAQDYRLGQNEVGTLSGSVKDASTSIGIANALVRVYDSEGNEVTSTRTDSNGSYELTISTGEYVIKVSAGSYKSVKMAVTVNANTTTYNETLLMISNGFSTGYVNGTITNSVTEVVVPNVTLKFRKNWNNMTGTVVYTSSTNEHGFYEVSSSDLSIGFYTMEMIKSGYITGYKNIFVSPLDVSAQNGVLSPVTSNNTYRMVLTWGENPRDLDSHVSGTLSDGNSFHVYYSHKSQSDGDTEVCNLDVDDTDGYGPETTTLIPSTSSPYYYYIYKFAGSGSISTSGAQIKLYRGDTLIETFNAPTDQGTSDYWNVFSIVNGEIIIKNTITSSEDTSYVN